MVKITVNRKEVEQIMTKEKITLAELKRKTSQIISELQENNERFEQLHNNEALTLKEYERTWGRLFQEKIELQKELDDLHTRLLINWVKDHQLKINLGGW